MSKVPVLRKAATIVNQYQDGISSREVSLLLEADPNLVSNALLNAFSRGLVARKKVDENRGAAGGARYRYFPLSSTVSGVVTAKPSKPKNKVAPTHITYMNSLIATQHRPAMPFTLEVVTQYKMVFDNGVELQLSRDQYDALQTLTGEYA